MSRHAQFLVALSALLATASLVNAGEAPGDNACTLAEPPPAAGELAFDTRKVKLEGRVYPRLSDLPPGYTGCQVLWTTINGQSARTVIRLQNGRVESIDPKIEEPWCAKGEKSGKTGCYPRREALQVSFPPGCAARRVSGAYPKECMDSFLTEHRILDATVD